MKKWLKSLTVVAAIALVILPCCLFSACSGNSSNNSSSNHTPAAGDTYSYAAAEFQWDETLAADMTAEDKDEMASAVIPMFETMKLSFTSATVVELTIDGETDTATYTIANGKVTITFPTLTTEDDSVIDDSGLNDASNNPREPMVFTIKGNTLVSDAMDVGSSAFKVVITFNLNK